MKTQHEAPMGSQPISDPICAYPQSNLTAPPLKVQVDGNGGYMTGAELWAECARYARLAALHFHGEGADADDVFQDAAVLCLTFPDKYPGKPAAELVLLARRAIWNRTLDKLRSETSHRKTLLKIHAKRPSTYNTRQQMLRDGGASVLPNTDAEAEEALDAIEEQLPDEDRPLYRRYITGCKLSCIHAETGAYKEKVYEMIRRVRRAAAEYA